MGCTTPEDVDTKKNNNESSYSSSTKPTNRQKYPPGTMIMLSGEDLKRFNETGELPNREVVDLRDPFERMLEKQSGTPLPPNLEVIAQKAAKLAKQGGKMDELKKIGEDLNRRGGIHLMKSVIYRIGYLGASMRTVEIAWDGIGDWQA